MIRVSRRKVGVLLLIAFVVSCSHASEESAEPGRTDDRAIAVTESPAEPIRSTVADILADPDAYVGKTVIVDATFMGWKGSCLGVPPETRSDWMIESGGECIYVSGRLPEGFSTLPRSPSIGRAVTVEADVLVDREGVPYLKLPREQRP